MKTATLTPELLSTLEMQGFNYFLGQSEDLPFKDVSDIAVRVILTPKKLQKESEVLPDGYDSCYNITDGDALEMARGVENVEFLVNIP